MTWVMKAWVRSMPAETPEAVQMLSETTHRARGIYDLICGYISAPQKCLSGHYASEIGGDSHPIDLRGQSYHLVPSVLVRRSGFAIQEPSLGDDDSSCTDREEVLEFRIGSLDVIEDARIIADCSGTSATWDEEYV